MRAHILFILILLGLISCAEQQPKEGSLLAYIPENASVVIKINDIKAFYQECKDNAVLAELGQLDLGKKVATSLAPLSYIHSSQEGMLSLNIDSLNTLHFTFVSQDTLPYIVLKEHPTARTETVTHNAIALTKYSVKDDVFYTRRVGKQELLSSSQEQLTRFSDTPPVHSAAAMFSSFNKMAKPSKLGHLWVNLSESKALAAYLTDGENTLSPSLFADWLSLDISLEKEGLMLNGLSIAKDSTNKYLNLFSTSRPLTNTLASYLPQNASAFTSYTFEDYTNFTQNQDHYLERQQTVDSVWSSVEELGSAYIGEAQVVLLKTFGTAQVTDYLKTKNQNTVDFQGSEIWELADSTGVTKTLAPLITGFNPKYSSIIANTVILSETQTAVEALIIAHKNGNTLHESPLYATVKKETTAASTLLSVHTAEGFKNLLQRYQLKTLAAQFSTRDFSDYVFGTEIVADAAFYHTSFFARKVAATNAKNSISQYLKTQINAPVAVTPQFVLNHRTKKNEIILQDDNNVLYLLSNNGTILWEKKLESGVKGQIHQVDLYKNGNLQFAFTTNNAFMILDRNGKTVKPFPIPFKDGNLNPLAVFDYDGKKDYRFVVTQNNEVFMFNTKGKIVSGFNYKKAESNIIAAPEHLRIGRKDYLIFKLADKTLKILNRVGDNRIRVNEKIAFSNNPVRLYKNKITLTSDTGVLYQVGSDSKVEKTSLNLNADHGMDATSKTLAVINDNILSIRGKKTTLEFGVYSKPKVFYLNDKIYVSVTDIQNQKVYLFDSQSEPIPNFPIYGISSIDMADMDNDGKPEILLLDQENVVSVLSVN